MALPLILPVVAAGAGYIKGLFSSSSDDESNNNSGATGSGKIVLYGLAAVGAYTVVKGAKRVIDKGSGG